MRTFFPLGLVAVLIMPLFAADNGIPRVSLREAISLGEEFLRTNKIDTSQHQRSEGTLGIYPGGPNYWDIRWSPTNKAIKDDFIDLRVDMDGTVNHLVH